LKGGAKQRNPYQVLTLSGCDTSKVEDKEFEAVTMSDWKLLDGITHCQRSLFLVGNTWNNTSREQTLTT
jgi:hypothetical protein